MTDRVSVGAAIKRLEDPPLLTGRGRYVDDVVRAGMLHAVVVRSAFAHARLRDVDVSRAAAHPGVVACLTARDLHPVPRIPIRQGGKPGYAAYLQPPLATDRVRYVGEPVAVIVATNASAAVDARELVQIAYEEMPAVVDPADAMRDSTARLFDDGNVADSWTTTVGDVDAALHGAACVVTEQLSIGRQTGVPLEPRGLVAEWDTGANRLTVWGPTKIPYFTRRTLATLLDLDETQIDFVGCDVGGGFGVRGEFYPEDFLVPHLARRLGRPVKWVEERREQFLAINHSRQQEWSVTIAADARGRLLALDATLVNVMGGYLRPHGVWVPALTTAYLSGPYRVPAFRCHVSCVMTNRTPTGSVRSPGFYEGTFVRERMMDVLAARVGCDSAEIRRRNLAAPDDGGYSVNAVATSVIGREADFTGEDFGAMFEQALTASQYDARLAACRERNEAGGALRYGVGLAAVVETSGVGPFESARVALTDDGTIALACGATSVGQGITTTLAQVCAEVLTVSPDEIDVRLGDSRWMPHGVGSSASRSMVMAGSAVHGAALRLRDRIIALAAKHFEASPDDVTLHDGAAIVRGLPDRRCTLGEIAAMATEQLQGEWRHETIKSLGSLSVHVCVVGVDTTTGEVHPETYFVLCDVGRAINPTIVDGQLVGGVIYGLGHATMEELVYDASGQLVTGTLMDYALPRADGVPTVEIVRHDVPAPSNPLGVKGAGESGTSGVGAALANAVANAIGPAAARHLPITASRVLGALDATTPAS
jgi:carbon-monoxide dehydrogenase large subunit/6-hydroxypseudooxynicotine dehydrogenase subunit gamma